MKYVYVIVLGIPLALILSIFLFLIIFIGIIGNFYKHGILDGLRNFESKLIKMRNSIKK